MDASSSTEARAVPQLKTRNQRLDSLSASSGTWERGNVSLNARSPPVRTDELADRLDREMNISSKKATDSTPGPITSETKRSTEESSSEVKSSTSSSDGLYQLKPRQGLEGYGFRPRSGASTPTTGVGPNMTSISASKKSVGFPGPNRSLLSPPATASSSSRSQRLGSQHEQEADYLDEIMDRQQEDRGPFEDEDTDGYGFPRNDKAAEPNNMTESEIADSEGLGWPAKLTHQRLHATPEERLHNLQRLSGAVRTVLECLGEDPDREGLERTPERYAKALLWMTKGYEDRLSGELLACSSEKFKVDCSS